MRKFLALVVVFAAGVVALLPVMVSALPSDPICQTLNAGDEDWEVAGCGEEEGDTVFSKVPGALTAVFSVAGIVAVGVIIFGGVRYTISQGDPGKVKKAKDTIMYAVIGLVVTLLAYAIVIFIINMTVPSDVAMEPGGRTVTVHIEEDEYA